MRIPADTAVDALAYARSEFPDLTYGAIARAHIEAIEAGRDPEPEQCPASDYASGYAYACGYQD